MPASPIYRRNSRDASSLTGSWLSPAYILTSIFALSTLTLTLGISQSKYLAQAPVSTDIGMFKPSSRFLFLYNTLTPMLTTILTPVLFLLHLFLRPASTLYLFSVLLPILNTLTSVLWTRCEIVPTSPIPDYPRAPQHTNPNAKLWPLCPQRNYTTPQHDLQSSAQWLKLFLGWVVAALCLIYVGVVTEGWARGRGERRGSFGNREKDGLLGSPDLRNSADFIVDEEKRNV